MDPLPDGQESLPSESPPEELESLPDGQESLPHGEDSLPEELESLPDGQESLVDDEESLSEFMVGAIVPVPGIFAEDDGNRKEALPGACCSKMCIQCIQAECAPQLLQWQRQQCKMSNDDQNEFLFNMLLCMRVAQGSDGASTGHRGRARRGRSFRLFGRDMCCNAFRESLDIGQSRLYRLLHWMKLGHTKAPADLRHTAPHERRAAFQKCDASLQWAYDVLAESYNSADVHAADAGDKGDESLLAVPTIDGFREWIYGPGATTTATSAVGGEVKWLPPMALVDLYDLCKMHASTFPTGTLPCFSTFHRVYRETWWRSLRFRAKIMHSKCDDCERLKKLRKDATSPSAAEAVQAEHMEHVRSQALDRAVDERIQLAARDATTTPGGVQHGRSILNMDMDAMDSHKFKCPRNLPMAKEMDPLWRPPQKMVGGIVDGGWDYFWLIPPDIIKNANMSTTLTVDMFQHIAGELDSRGVPMPDTFRVHTDNASGEVKNQTFMKCMAWLAHKQFISAEMTQFRVGHSHGRIDQAFSVIGTAINKRIVLQTPDDFQQVIEATKARSGQRPARVVQIGALYNWEDYFAALGIAPHNHTQNPGMKPKSEEACHVFRFQRRDRMSFRPGQEPHSVFVDPPAADDVILVTKHYLGSESWAQEPEVFCPGARFRELPAEGPLPIPGRTRFGARQVKEFGKTALAVEQSPWNMWRAAKWLRALVQDNTNGTSESWKPPQISWVLASHRLSHGLIADSFPRALPSVTPVPVTMQDVRHRLRRKQPASGPANPQDGPKMKKIRTRQRGQNLVEPSPGESVAGAPLLAVNQAGAPSHVATPPDEDVDVNDDGANVARPRNHQMTTRMRKRLLKVMEQPDLGCSKCRKSPIGCTACRHVRDSWVSLHQGMMIFASGGA